MYQMNRIRSAPGFFLLFLLFSCAAPNKGSEEKDANGKKIEYVYYTPTGSNVPIRVRKVEAVTPPSETAAAQKALTDLQRESAADKSPSAGGR
jgi:hypothetical protein